MQYLSLFGLLIRMTVWKVFFASIICCGLLYIMSGNACLIFEFALVTLCLSLTFKRNNRGGLATFRRLPFDRRALKFSFAIVAALNFVFGTLLLKFGVLVKIYYEMKKSMPDKNLFSIITNPVFYLREEKYGLLYRVVPFSNMLIFILYSVVVLCFSIAVTRRVNYEAKY